MISGKHSINLDSDGWCVWAVSVFFTTRCELCYCTRQHIPGVPYINETVSESAELLCEFCLKNQLLSRRDFWRQDTYVLLFRTTFLVSEQPPSRGNK